MEITKQVIQNSIAAKPFGVVEPFISGEKSKVDGFYKKIFADLERTGKISIYREVDHYGSGYASYISAFIYPRDGSSLVEFSSHVETTGLLLYCSRLAPIAVYGASARTQNKNNQGSSSGFITLENLYESPKGDWIAFLRLLCKTLEENGVIMPPKDVLMQPAPKDIKIPTVFDPPYYIYDTLFYWQD